MAHEISISNATARDMVARITGPETTFFMDSLRRRTAIETPSDGQWVLERNISNSERQRLKAVVEQSLELSQPAADAKAMSLIARLVAAFRRGDRTSDVQLREEMAAFLMAVRGLPEWAIEDAVIACIRGEGRERPDFLPFPPELAAMARKAMEPMKETTWRAGKMLDAKVEIPKADRQGRAEKVARLMAGWVREGTQI